MSDETDRPVRMPLQLLHMGDSRRAPLLVDADRHEVADIETGSHVENQRIAALILTAVNAHDALVEACKKCIAAYEDRRDNTPTGELWPDPNHIYYARAALAQVQP